MKLLARICNLWGRSPLDFSVLLLTANVVVTRLTRLWRIVAPAERCIFRSWFGRIDKSAALRAMRRRRSPRAQIGELDLIAPVQWQILDRGFDHLA
jgi:hypothetical protein